MATLLKNCKIYDGTGSDAVTGSVLFDGDRILEVGSVDERKADKVIDLEGMSLASGFIEFGITQRISGIRIRIFGYKVVFGTSRQPCGQHSHKYEHQTA